MQNKVTKITALSTFGFILSALLFSACGNTGNTNANNSTTNKSNNSTPIPNVEPSIDRTPPPANANQAAAKTDDTTDMTTTDGQLRVGKSDSYILYLGKESGDLAAYCFPNDSEAGRAILAACKNGDQCEFTGEIDFNADCKIPDAETEGMLSAKAKIVKLKRVKKLAGKK